MLGFSANRSSARVSLPTNEGAALWVRWAYWAPFGACGLVFVALCFASPYFLTGENLSSLARQSALIGIPALGLTPIMILGGIDLSLGAVMGLAGVCGALLLEAGIPSLPSLLGAIAVGGTCGLANGIGIACLKVKPFVITLATWGAAYGLALVLSGGLPIAPFPGFTGGIYSGNVLHIVPVPIVIWASIALFFGWGLKCPIWARPSKASDRNGGARSDFPDPSRLYIILPYLLGGWLAGLAGWMDASQMMVAQPTIGLGNEIWVIAAVVLGGAGFSGGEGSISGSVAGAFLVGMILDGCTLLGVPLDWQMVITGLLLLLAASANQLRQRRRKRV